MAELERDLGAAEYDGWVRYYAEEPWGAYRDNLHAALIADTVARAHGGKKSKLSDYILKPATVRRNEELAEGLARLRLFSKRKA